jgi:protein-tyrosine phosphatase
MKKILFICTGNICRSPTAHAIARHKVKALNLENEFYFDSAGLISYHSGEASDPRAIEVGKFNNISFDKIRSRQITKKDFENFDLIMAMDRGHFADLYDLADDKHLHKIKLFLEFCETKNPWNNEVIDPYYLTKNDFVKVFEVIETAIDNLIKVSAKAPYNG